MVTKMPVVGLVMYFLAYIACHVAIGWHLKQIEKLNKDKPGNKQKELEEKWMRRLFKFFPMLYVIFLLIVFNL